MSCTENLSHLKAADFKKEIGGKETALFILKNNQGNEVAITNYGGAICSIMVPDKDGNYANVIQGHDSIDNLLNSPEPFLSTLVGRYGNRICKGKFTIDGRSTISPSTTAPTISTVALQASTQEFGTQSRPTHRH